MYIKFRGPYSAIDKEPMKVNIEFLEVRGCCIGGNFAATHKAFLKEQEYRKNNPPEPRAKKPFIIIRDN